MMSCHHQPHEDHDMTVLFRVGLKENDWNGYGPATVAQPVQDDEKD